MSEKFHYITVATKPHIVLDTIKKKVNKLDESIIILGESENRWIGWEGNGNFGVKLREVSDFLKRPELGHNDIVLFTDAYDVIYCGNRPEIIKRYLEFSKPIVFGCEKLCQPDTFLSERYNNRDKEFPYLNSGMFIGRVWALRQCMEGYQYIDKVEDQRYWTDKFLNTNSDIIELDYDNKLFFNTVEINMNWVLIDRDSFGTVFLYKDKNPMFVHVNGPDKSFINSLL